MPFITQGVPNDELDAFIRSVRLQGASEVEVLDNGDGTSDVTVYFDDETDNPGPSLKG